MSTISFSEFRRRMSLPRLVGLREIEILISNCATLRETSLSLRGFSALDSLTCLSGLYWLQELDCTGTSVSDLGPLAGLNVLEGLDCSFTFVTDLGPLAELGVLKSLHCTNNQISDVGPLAGLSTLQSLRCSKTQVSDLGPLAGLSALESLDCSITSVTDLGPLAGLNALKSLRCTNTQISNLEPLTGLIALESLDCSATSVTDLGPFAEQSALKTLSCTNNMQISDLRSLAGLSALETLNCWDTQISDLGPLAGLSALETLNCPYTQIFDLGPLAGLSALQNLDCGNTKISDLGPLAGLSALQNLDCTSTQVFDLGPLAGLPALQSLNCANTQVSDLGPLAGLCALQSLNCKSTHVSDLEPLAGLSALQNLDCTSTQVCDLGPLVGLCALQRLDCASTQVSDLGPLAGLSELQSIFCSSTRVCDLAPLAGLSSLQSLICSFTQVLDLAPLAGLSALQSLNCSGTSIASWPRDALNWPALAEVFAYKARIDQIPSEDLSNYATENCLPKMKSYFADLAAGATPLERSKIIILGNGQVGKTQLRRWLLNSAETPFPYDPSIKSTHGIEVMRGPVALPSGKAPLDASLWDFGGQDIFHGTHSLFMKTRAIFILCWCPPQEDSREQTLDGLTHQNRPIPYWVDYVRQLAGPDNPLIFVQTQCDTPAQRQPHRFSQVNLKAFESHRFVEFSAETSLGGASLREAIGEAAKWIKDRHGVPLIGTGRMKVLNQLEQWRSDDCARSPEARQHKWMSQAEFAALCEDAGGISSHAHLLNFLHHAGVVFYREGLFDDRIILDQDWALNAIYAVFNRDHCYKMIRRMNGRFYREDVALKVWQDYGRDEQKLFLSMMESCGIVFSHYRRSDHDDDIEYIAPELLPERARMAARIESGWHGGEVVEMRLRYSLLHYGLIRQIVARIGRESRVFGVYWQTGVLFYEQVRQSDAIIEAVVDEDGWGGDIVISCRNGRANELLRLLVEEVEKIGKATGVSPEKQPDLPRHDNLRESEVEVAKTRPLRLGSHPSANGKWYVSYAWGDDTPEGKERKAKVDALCDAAEVRGIKIVRDKDTIGNGDSIRGFMDSLVDGDRIIVILSKKYLHSPNCMFELFHAWQKQQANPDLLAKAVRAYRLPCAKFGKLRERGEVGKYWADEVEATKPVRENLGIGDGGDYVLMKHFALSVSDILRAINDRITPRDWDEFLDWAFGE